MQQSSLFNLLAVSHHMFLFPWQKQYWHHLQSINFHHFCQPAFFSVDNVTDLAGNISFVRYHYFKVASTQCFITALRVQILWGYKSKYRKHLALVFTSLHKESNESCVNKYRLPDKLGASLILKFTCFN